MWTSFEDCGLFGCTPRFAYNHNYCRTPDEDHKGAWCYTTEDGEWAPRHRSCLILDSISLPNAGSGGCFGLKIFDNEGNILYNATLSMQIKKNTPTDSLNYVFTEKRRNWNLQQNIPGNAHTSGILMDGN